MLSATLVKRLPDFTLDVKIGTDAPVLALVGPSGSGKTLTLQCLAGLMRPDEGQVVVDGRVLFDSHRGIDLAPQRRRLGYVFQGYALFPHLTVAENVAYGLSTIRDARLRVERTGLVLDRLGLAGFDRRYPGELSGGQQQRVALARALAIDPDLLLLDEPLSALDAPLRRELRSELARIIREWRKTTVIVTHDLSEAYQIADDVVVYEGGRVVAAAPKAELLWQPTSARVAELIGVRNLFAGHVIDASPAAVRIDWSGQMLSAINSKTHPLTLPAGAPLAFFIRPEYVRLVRKDRPLGSDDLHSNTLEGDIVDEVDEGTRCVLTIRIASAAHGPDGSERDLEVEIPKLVYEMLDVARDRHWQLTIQPSSIQILPLA